MVSHSESGKGTATVTIIKKDKNGVVKSIEHYEGNIFLTYGVEILWYIVVGSITNVTLGICVGNGSTPASQVKHASRAQSNHAQALGKFQ
jgi:hypothetical protein